MAMVVLPDPPFGFSTTMRCIKIPVPSKIMSLRSLRMRDTARKPQCRSVETSRACEPRHGLLGGRRSLASPQPVNRGSSLMEVFLLLWDDLDDWVGAAAHACWLRGLA